MTRPESAGEARRYHRTIMAIGAAVLVICLSEFVYGLVLESRFLIRDGAEWGYDVAIYLIAAVAFGRGERAEQIAAILLALVLITAGVVTLWQIWLTYVDPPEVEPFSITLSGTLIILEAWAVGAALWPFRHSSNPVIEATWLSARNDVVSSTLYAIVMMGARMMPMRWPQMAVDAFTVVLCLQAGGKIMLDVWRPQDAAAREPA